MRVDTVIGGADRVYGYVIVFLGAGFGGALRRSINLLAARLVGTGFPFGTFAIDVSGSLAMGLLAGVFHFQE